VARHLERALVVAPSGTGEVFDWVSDDLFELELRIHDFAFQFRLLEIGEMEIPRSRLWKKRLRHQARRNPQRVLGNRAYECLRAVLLGEPRQ
jgi:hypothetical protein